MKRIDIPVWNAPGTRPDDTLIAEGYKKLDVPASAHFNYIMNAITKGLNEIQRSYIDRREGLINSGVATPNSEILNTWVEVPSKTKITDLGNGLYRVGTATGFSSSLFPIQLSALDWVRQTGFVSTMTEYSLIFSVRYSTDTEPTVSLSGTPDNMQVKEVIVGETKLIGTLKETQYQVVFTVLSGSSNNIGCTLDINLGTGTATTIFITQPKTVYGRFYAGDTLSSTMYYRLSSQTFKFHGEATIEEFNQNTTVDNITNRFGSYIVNTEQVPNRLGLPNNVNAVIANLSTVIPGSEGSLNSANLLSSLAITRDIYSGNVSLYISSVDNNNTRKNFIKMMSVEETEMVLRDYVLISSVDSILSAYATTSDLTNYVDIRSTFSWQKSKVTKDNGEPLVQLANSTPTALRTELLRVLDLKSTMITIDTDTTTLGLPSLYVGTGSKATNYQETLTSGNIKLWGTLVATGTTSPKRIYQGTLLGVATSVVGDVASFKGSPLAVDITINLELPASDPNFVTSITRATATTLGRAIEQGLNGSMELIQERARLAYRGDLLFSGSASTTGSTITLADSLVKYSHLSIEYHNGTMGDVVEVPLDVLREQRNSISIQSQNLRDDGKEGWLYEIMLRTPDDYAYVGNTLSIEHNNRFTLSTNTGVAGSYMVIKNIYGIQK